MAALEVVEDGDGDGESSSGDGWVDRIDVLLGELRAAVADGSPVSDAVRVDRVGRLERLRSAVVAVQVAESVRFAQSQAERQLAVGVHPRDVGRGVADQLALACRVSPVVGSRRWGVARALWFDLPGIYGLLTAGRVSEQVAEVVVSETRHLNAATRRGVDVAVVGAGIDTMGVRSAAACVRRYAYTADPVGYVDRGRHERRHRRVGLRPAPDTMAVLTGYLPVEQGVACYAALRRHTDTRVAAGDPRSRDQIMADTLTERLTGQTRAADVNVELQILMPLEALTGADPTRSAELVGAGPLPAGLAAHIITSTGGRRWWRRLFTSPAGHIVGGDPRRRRFDGFLAQLITVRDRGCRDPYCDAPIRHTDHIRPWRTGGPTTLTNGRGTCERGNQVRELPGWTITLIHDGLRDAPHTVLTTTPTGHHYLSRAPDPP